MDKHSDELCILTTGGTFDKIYDEIRGELTFRRSQLPKIIKATRCALPITLKRVLAIDSLDMNTTHRQKIGKACANRNENKIIIIHGTDSMVETAQVVTQLHLKKTIVFTGAMIPFALENSDAIFNLGCAITAVQLLEPGVYICMNGQVFASNQVRKNHKLALFEGVPLSGTSIP